MTDRLWFRLDDVLSLAEHTLDCTEHCFTRAQIAARGPHGPALILTDVGSHAVLTSNGMLGRIDETDIGYTAYGGRISHTAHARIWRRAGQVADLAPRGRLAYLPLQHTIGAQLPLIDLLRYASWLSQHWISLRHGRASLLYSGSVDPSDHRSDLAPAGTRWRRATVHLPACAPLRYPALIADGYTTADGDVIPRFDRPTVAAMIADFAGVPRAGLLPGEYPVLRFDGDILVLLDETGRTRRTGRTRAIDAVEESAATGLVEVDRCYPDRDGLYGVGAHLWPWQATGR